MKKYTLFAFILLILSLSSCKKKEVSELDQFVNKFNEIYPDGYIMTDSGWYEEIIIDYGDSFVSPTYYRFIGDVSFQESFFGCIVNQYYEMFTTHNSFYGKQKVSKYDGERYYYHEVEYIRTDGEYAYVLQPNDRLGSTKVGQVKKEFSCEEEYNNLNTILSEYRGEESTLPYGDRYISVDVKDNVLTIVKERISGIHFVTIKTTQYYFDQDLKLIKYYYHSKIEDTTSNTLLENSLVLRKVDKEEINVPTEYDKELEIEDGATIWIGKNN